MAMTASNLRADEPLLLELTAAATAAAGELLNGARDSLRARLAPGGRLDAERLEAEQTAAHGLAWLAVYVEALRQLEGWAGGCRVRLDWASARS